MQRVLFYADLFTFHYTTHQFPQLSMMYFKFLILFFKNFYLFNKIICSWQDNCKIHKYTYDELTCFQFVFLVYFRFWLNLTRFSWDDSFKITSLNNYSTKICKPFRFYTNFAHSFFEIKTCLKQRLHLAGV